MLARIRRVLALGMLTVALVATPAAARPGELRVALDAPAVRAELAGAPVTVSFAATAGQRLTLVVRRDRRNTADVTDIDVRRGRAVVASGALLPGWTSESVDLTASATGEHTAEIRPRGRGAETIHVHLAGSSSTRLTLNRPAVTVAIDRPGERALAEFRAVAGQRLTVAARRGSLTRDAFTSLDIRGPEGRLPESSALSYGSDEQFMDFTAPVSGRYSVEVNPEALHTGTVRLWLVEALAARLRPGGRPVELDFAHPGQRAVVTFRAVEGQSLTLTARRGTLALSEPATLLVRTPIGLVVTAGELSRRRPATTLRLSASTGRYTVEIDPAGADTGTMQVALGVVRSGRSQAGHVPPPAQR